MVERKITLKVYVLALIVTVAIFLLGAYVGQIVDVQVTETLMEQMEYYFEESASMQVMLLFEDSPSFCPLYMNESDNLEEITINLGEQLTYFEEVKGVNDEDLKRQYFLLETKSYLFAKKINDVCGIEKNLILYFYSSDCEKCKEQGNELTSFSHEFEGDLRIYSFDGELNSPVVEGLKNEYNITAYPSIVINGVTKKGFKDKGYLLNILK